MSDKCDFWLQSEKEDDKLYEEGLGDPNWALSIALYGSWTLICLFTLKGMRVMSALLYVTGILPIIFLLFCLFQRIDGSLPLQVLSIDPAILLDLTIWIKAAGFTLKTIGLTVPILSCLCAYNRTHYKLDTLVPIIILVNLIYTWMSLTFNVAYDTGLNLDFSIRMLNGLGNEGKIFPVLFLVYVTLTKLNAASVLTDSVITSLGDSIAWLANWRLLTSIIYAFVSFIFGLIFIVPNGWQMVLITQKALEVSSVLLIPLVIFSIIFGYGLKALSDNVYIMSGLSISGLSKVWLVAFLPCALFPIMVSYFKSDGLLKLHSNFYANLHLFGIISIITLIPVVYAIVLILKTYCRRNSIVALFRRTPGWPHETQTKPQFVHSASFERYRTRRANVANIEEHDNLAMNEL